MFHSVFLKRFTGMPLAVVASLPPIVHTNIVPQHEAIKAAAQFVALGDICQLGWVQLADTSWERLEDLRETYPT